MLLSQFIVRRYESVTNWEANRFETMTSGEAKK
uniref:Uncharacterized protein n=1 Tax=Arundo donax TaxID=35708 RepID=A0A0A9ACQ9_ARUDO